MLDYYNKNALISENETEGALDIKRVLVPLKGERSAEFVLSYANMVARWFSAEISLLHVLPSCDRAHSYGYRHIPYPDDQHDRGAILANSYLQEIASRIRPFTRNVRWGVTTGPTAPMIASRARAVEAGLITLTSDVKMGWQRFTRDSVLLDLWHITPTPMLVIKEDLLNTSGVSVIEPHTFIVPFEKYRTASIVLPFLKSLINIRNTKVALVVGSNFSSNGSEDAVNIAVSNLERGNDMVTTHITKNPVNLVSELQDASPGSWVIVGSRLRPYLTRSVFGSFAHKIFRVARGPVIIVPDIRVMKRLERFHSRIEVFRNALET